MPGIAAKQNDLIADAVAEARASQTASADARRAELAAAEHDLVRASGTIERYLAAFENGTRAKRRWNGCSRWARRRSVTSGGPTAGAESR